MLYIGVKHRESVFIFILSHLTYTAFAYHEYFMNIFPKN
ncbi:hypothetical protein EMIT079MI2_120032 [Bacillus sp. IT-79MI2]